MLRICKLIEKTEGQSKQARQIYRWDMTLSLQEGEKKKTLALWKVCMILWDWQVLSNRFHGVGGGNTRLQFYIFIIFPENNSWFSGFFFESHCLAALLDWNQKCCFQTRKDKMDWGLDLKNPHFSVEHIVVKRWPPYNKCGICLKIVQNKLHPVPSGFWQKKERTHVGWLKQRLVLKKKSEGRFNLGTPTGPNSPDREIGLRSDIVLASNILIKWSGAEKVLTLWWK